MRKLHIARLQIIAGACWLALGTFALVSPSVTYFTVIQYSGIALLLDGLLLAALSYAGPAGKKERAWRFIESIVDLGFATILLLDPLFSFFVFPFIVSPWMATKGLIKMVSSLTLAKNVHGWSGDFLAGVLLLAFSIFIPHDPLGKPFGITVLIGVIGLTLGAVYIYDYYRSPGRRHIPSV
jgi:uncharacterized membrane protein HdeD (DUF308 family)